MQRCAERLARRDDVETGQEGKARGNGMKRGEQRREDVGGDVNR